MDFFVFSLLFSRIQQSQVIHDFYLGYCLLGSVSLFNNPIQFQGPTHPQYTAATIPYILLSSPAFVFFTSRECITPSPNQKTVLVSSTAEIDQILALLTNIEVKSTAYRISIFTGSWFIVGGGGGVEGT